MPLLKNMLCHLDRHRLVPFIFLSRYLFKNDSKPLLSHFPPHKKAHFIPYPDLSFWTALEIYGRTSAIPKRQSAKLPYPNFREYGDRAVLFAVLELLEADKNVILIDDDVMLLRDPIPFLAGPHIKSDIVTPEDTRQCVFISAPLFDVVKGPSIQPEINLGLTSFRANDRTTKLVHRWMNAVEWNGQKTFRLFRRLVNVDTSCHIRRKSFQDVKVSPDLPSICYLSNTLFQNGFCQ